MHKYMYILLLVRQTIIIYYQTFTFMSGRGAFGRAFGRAFEYLYKISKDNTKLSDKTDEGRFLLLLLLY